MSNETMIPQLRFEGFSGEWKTQALSDVAKIVGGGTPDTAIPEYWNGDINWYSPTEIGLTRFVKESTRKITDLGFQKSSARLLPANQTVLFTSRAGIGDMAILKAEGTTNQGFQSLIVNDHNDVYFIYSMGHLIKREALRVASGSTFLEISGKALGKIKQQFPLKKEQTKIGELFQKLDRAIELQQQKVEQSERYKKAMLQKMFPQKGETEPQLRFEGFSGEWKTVKLGDIANIRRGASPRPISDPVWFDENSSIGWVRISDVTKSNGMLKETTQYLSKKGIEKSRFIPAGNLIMSICATIGRPIYTGIEVCIHDGFVVFDNLKADLLCLLYILQLIEKNWQRYGQPGAQVNLNSDIVSQEKIKLPSLEEQTKIGEFFQALDAHIEAETKKLNHYESLKKAMLQRMFV